MVWAAEKLLLNSERCSFVQASLALWRSCAFCRCRSDGHGPNFVFVLQLTGCERQAYITLRRGVRCPVRGFPRMASLVFERLSRVGKILLQFLCECLPALGVN